MSKKYLSVTFAYVGVIVGAGLASGQDLLQYFLSFGATGLIDIAALGAGALALYLNVDRIWDFDARGSGQVASCNLGLDEDPKASFSGDWVGY
mgnify:CR=1 FL=1